MEYDEAVLIVNQNLGYYPATDVENLFLTNWSTLSKDEATNRVYAVNALPREDRPPHKLVYITNLTNLEGMPGQKTAYLVNPEVLPKETIVISRGYVICPRCKDRLETGGGVFAICFRCKWTVYADDSDL